MEENEPQIKDITAGKLETDCSAVDSIFENNLLDTDLAGQTLAECPKVAAGLTNEFSEVNGDERMKNRLKKIKAKTKVGDQSIDHIKVDIDSTENLSEGITNGKRKRGKEKTKGNKNIKGEILEEGKDHETVNLHLSVEDHRRSTAGKLTENELTTQESEVSLEKESPLSSFVEDNAKTSDLCTEEEADVLPERSEDSNPNQTDVENPKFENCLNEPNDEIVIAEGKGLVEGGSVGNSCDAELTIHISNPCLKEVEYCVQSPQIAHASSCNRKLIVLDVNGLLAHIMFPGHKNCRGDTNILGREVFKRPFCDDFLKFCFQNFDVGIWSSRSKRLIDRVVEYLLGDLQDKMKFCWDMDHSTQTGFNTLENCRKPMVCKELRKIWESDDPDLPWKKGYYNESNTLLLDDSPYKALLNPVNTAIFPKSYQYEDKNDNSLGPGGDLRVYLEGLLTSENVQKYVEQHPFGQPAINEASKSWKFYSGVLQSMSSKGR